MNLRILLSLWTLGVLILQAASHKIAVKPTEEALQVKPAPKQNVVSKNSKQFDKVENSNEPHIPPLKQHEVPIEKPHDKKTKNPISKHEELILKSHDGQTKNPKPCSKCNDKSINKSEDQLSNKRLAQSKKDNVKLPMNHGIDLSKEQEKSENKSEALHTYNKQPEGQQLSKETGEKHATAVTKTNEDPIATVEENTTNKIIENSTNKPEKKHTKKRGGKSTKKRGRKSSKRRRRKSSKKRGKKSSKKRSKKRGEKQPSIDQELLLNKQPSVQPSDGEIPNNKPSSGQQKISPKSDEPNGQQVKPDTQQQSSIDTTDIKVTSGATTSSNVDSSLESNNKTQTKVKKQSTIKPDSTDIDQQIKTTFIKTENDSSAFSNVRSSQETDNKTWTKTVIKEQQIEKLPILLDSQNGVTPKTTQDGDWLTTPAPKGSTISQDPTDASKIKNRSKSEIITEPIKNKSQVLKTIFKETESKTNTSAKTQKSREIANKESSKTIEIKAGDYNIQKSPIRKDSPLATQPVDIKTKYVETESYSSDSTKVQSSQKIDNKERAKTIVIEQNENRNLGEPEEMSQSKQQNAFSPNPLKDVNSSTTSAPEVSLISPEPIDSSSLPQPDIAQLSKEPKQETKSPTHPIGNSKPSKSKTITKTNIGDKPLETKTTYIITESDSSFSAKSQMSQETDNKAWTKTQTITKQANLNNPLPESNGLPRATPSVEMKTTNIIAETNSSTSTKTQSSQEIDNKASTKTIIEEKSGDNRQGKIPQTSQGAEPKDASLLPIPDTPQSTNEAKQIKPSTVQPNNSIDNPKPIKRQIITKPNAGEQPQEIKTSYVETESEIDASTKSHISQQIENEAKVKTILKEKTVNNQHGKLSQIPKGEQQNEASAEPPHDVECSDTLEPEVLTSSPETVDMMLIHPQPYFAPSSEQLENRDENTDATTQSSSPIGKWEPKGSVSLIPDDDDPQLVSTYFRKPIRQCICFDSFSQVPKELREKLIREHQESL